ncbi:PepSY domain-containing protein [Mucilaginibacter conchicola]|uniref:PepSY domain-containing protein n=1 Tax=Mucilaginibacter conchicola TaxID=2303333 RepID=A0A372NS80_9SPHI|nr:PepSY-associated TM helix domain-containing protein [Mucilaginibacter conchicola]RFZ91205.1 PepSY domain-containing protein [Mucilaginibacter conchicola]
MSSFKKTVLFLHRWLGFLSGLVVFIVSISGCVYSFQDQIQDALFSYRKVTRGSGDVLLPSRLITIAKERYPDGKVSLVNYYTPDRTAQVRINTGKVQHSLFIDPYTGRLVHDDPDFKHNFFNTVKSIHFYCFFPPAIGKTIVGASTIIFMIIMITGLVLWWPRRKFDRKRSLTIKWKTRWRRVNYDLHSVIGFYVFSISFLLAFSGLSMSYDWLSKSIYWVANGGQEYKKELKKYTSDTTTKVQNIVVIQPIDAGFLYARKRSPKTEMMLISPGVLPKSPISYTCYPRVLHFSYSDTYSIDQYTGKILKELPNTKKSTGLVLLGMNYDIHVGQIAGLSGQIIMFLAGLISASLPVTGLFIYLGKKKSIQLRKGRGAHSVRQRRLDKSLN